MKYFLPSIFSLLFLMNCTRPSAENISETNFGTMPNGKTVSLFTLRNEAGAQVEITNYGGIIKSIKVPNKEGKYENIVAGFDSLSQYLEPNPFYGALVGRYANRIANGKFKIGENEYSLPINSGQNSIHGGFQGFDKAIWYPKPSGGKEPLLKLTYLSKDTEEGYPGNLTVEVIYQLLKDNSLKITYKAVTDKPTVVNLTNHSYFNLSGDFSQTVHKHSLKINAPFYTPVNASLIPLGTLEEVNNTPLDFREFKEIGKDIADYTNEQMKLGNGYDHNYVFALKPTNKLIKIAEVHESSSGRRMEVETTEPGVQFYTGNFLPKKQTAFCLETQHYPNSPNEPSFPSTLLEPGQEFVSTTIYRFSTD